MKLKFLRSLRNGLVSEQDLKRLQLMLDDPNRKANVEQAREARAAEARAAAMAEAVAKLRDNDPELTML